MDDENGLELSLSLAPCQSSSKSKVVGDNSSDTKTEGGDRSSKLINDFKHFLDGGTGKLESATGSQRRDLIRPDERGLRISNDSMCPEVEENKGPESSNKRKFFVGEISSQKRGRESHNSDLRERSRQSHISINTDDGSTAENEDVADSEVVGSISRIVSQRDNSGKKHSQGGAPSEIGKGVYSVFDTSAVGLSGQRGFTITPEKEFRAGKGPYNAALPSQSVNILNMPHSISSKEHGGVPSAVPGNVSASYGYSAVQIPVLDKDYSHSLVSHQQFHPSHAGRFTATTDTLNDEALKVYHAAKPPEVLQYSATSLDNARNGSSKDESDKLPSELSAITPGIGSDLKFGGCGSYPNLPWVSTKGPGPNGRTISGVTYKFSPTQIKIVCACHGSHMSPEEFIRHNSDEKTGSEAGPGLASLPGSSNPAASAQS